MDPIDYAPVLVLVLVLEAGSGVQMNLYFLYSSVYLFLLLLHHTYDPA